MHEKGFCYPAGKHYPGNSYCGGKNLVWFACMSHGYIYMCKIMLKKCQLFLLSQLQHINIDNRKIYNAHLKPHFNYMSLVWDDCGKVHFKKVNSQHQRAGKFFLSDPSIWSTEQKVSVLGILNLMQWLTDNKGIVVHQILDNNYPNYLSLCVRLTMYISKTLADWLLLLILVSCLNWLLVLLMLVSCLNQIIINDGGSHISVNGNTNTIVTSVCRTN